MSLVELKNVSCKRNFSFNENCRLNSELSRFLLGTSLSQFIKNSLLKSCVAKIVHSKCKELRHAYFKSLNTFIEVFDQYAELQPYFKSRFENSETPKIGTAILKFRFVKNFSFLL